MDMAKLREAVARCENPADLLALAEAARARAQALRERERSDRAEREARAWERVRSAKPGEALLLCADSGEADTVWACRGGSRRSREEPARFRAGSAMRISAIQPRARRLWAEGADGELYCLTPKELARVWAAPYPDEFRAMVAWAGGKARRPI